MSSHLQNRVLNVCVTLTNITKKYGESIAVDQLTLTIERGECFGLLGPNGAGKTTTLRLLLGLTNPDSGQIEVLGFPIPQRGREARMQIGVVPQFDNLDPDFSVLENLITYARYFGLKRKPVISEAKKLLEFAALSGRESARIDELSGGMKRRLTLARALVNDPPLLVLDEPTTGLDPQARQHIWQQLRALQRDGRTLLLTTHYMEEAERLCDTVAIMDRGHLVACGSPSQLIETHIEQHVAEIFDIHSPSTVISTAHFSGFRSEQNGDTILIYSDSRESLLSWLESGNLRYVYRPANLEDVFLTLTGRDLRD